MHPVLTSPALYVAVVALGIGCVLVARRMRPLSLRQRLVMHMILDTNAAPRKLALPPDLPRWHRTVGASMRHVSRDRDCMDLRDSPAADPAP